MKEHRVALIRERLVATLRPELLEIEDESRLHAGHAGAQDGRGHFRVTIVSESFTGLARLDRHRLVYEALGTLMRSDIHALTIHAYAPGDV